MERPICATCVHFREFGNDPGEGQCKRLPPAVILDVNGVALSVWPEVSDYQGCGEHPDFPAYIASLRGPERPDGVLETRPSRGPDDRGD